MQQIPLQNRLLHVRPAKGRRVIDPVTGLPLPQGGATVEYSPFYARRLQCGDVELLGAGPHEPLTEVEN